MLLSNKRGTKYRKSGGLTVQAKIVEARRPCGQHGRYIVSMPGFTNSDVIERFCMYWQSGRFVDL